MKEMRCCFRWYVPTRLHYCDEENKIIVLMRRETLDGKGIGRYVCVPNEHIDVEFCVNFDTRAESVIVKEGDDWKLAPGSQW